MVYWITGRSGSGKTTLAKKLERQIPGSVVIDGDEVRLLFPEDFTMAGRERNQKRITDMAIEIERDGGVPIIACVSPNKILRKTLQAKFYSCIEIQLPFGHLWEGTDYEE